MSTPWLKQSTAVTVSFGPFVDPSDGVTELTTTALAAADIQVDKNGAGFANKNDATAPTLDEEGWYLVTLDATDTDTLGILTVKAHDSATHLPVWGRFLVLPANVYDSFVSGSDLIDSNVAQWLGTAPQTPNTAGVPNVDTVQLDGDATAAARHALAASTIETFTVQSGSSQTVVQTDLTETTGDHYNGALLVFTSGFLFRQRTDVTDYNGTTKALTVTALTEIPASGDTAVLI